jgi:hypothetical protein
MGKRKNYMADWVEKPPGSLRYMEEWQIYMGERPVYHFRPASNTFA